MVIDRSEYVLEGIFTVQLYSYPIAQNRCAGMDELICSFAPLLGARGIAAMDIEEGEGESGDAAAGHPNLPSIPVDPIISFVGVP